MDVILRCNERNRFTLHRLMVLLENLAVPERWTLARTPAQLAAAVRAARRPVVLYSFMSTVWEETRDELAALRRERPDARIIAGGPHASALPASVLAAGADTVFRGEAERSFPAFWQRYVRGGETPWPRVVEPGEPLALDDIPVFARTADWFAPTEITRGCRYACKYCQTPQLFPRPIRHRSVAALRPWLAEQVTLGRLRFTALSPNALSYQSPRPGVANTDAIRELLTMCREVGIVYNIFGAYPGEVRPEYVTPAVVKLLAEFCANRTISIGTQAATDRLIAAAGRGHTAAAVEEAAALLADAGFIPIIDYLFGMPGETREDRSAQLAQMARLIARARVRVQGHYFMPLPDTPWMGIAPVEPEREYLEELRRYTRGGRLQGDWEEQRLQAHRMAAWQREWLAAPAR